MKINFYIISVFLFFTLPVFSQTSIKYEDILDKYESFEYSDVIRYSEIFLYNNDNIDEGILINVLTMKAVSHYSLRQESQAKQAFRDILEKNSFHQLSPSEVSPKIIQFFEEIKSAYIPSIRKDKETKSVVTLVDTVFNQKSILVKTNLYQNSFARSVLYPGLGHLYLGNTSKGWILTGLNSIMLGSMIYFIVETNDLQDKYINETNPNLINQRYEDYNSSYKTRNVLIGGYVALWLFTQIDLLFLSDDLFEENIKAELSLSTQYNKPKLNLNFQIALH